MGQLYEIAHVFYKLDNMTVRILESKNDNPGCTTGPVTLDTKTVFVKYRLDFDNRDYVRINYLLLAYYFWALGNVGIEFTKYIYFFT